MLTGASHKRYALSRRDTKVQIGKNRTIWSGWVGKCNIFELDISIKFDIRLQERVRRPNACISRL